MIELGGTIGDIESMPFIEALRQLKFQLPEKLGGNSHPEMLMQQEDAADMQRIYWKYSGYEMFLRFGVQAWDDPFPLRSSGLKA